MNEQITAKIIEDSVSPAGARLTTLQLTYHRYIHSELMTHRVFSRNASSSRAVPVAKTLDNVRNRPYEPVHWGANQSGMQAKLELDGNDLLEAQEIWRETAKMVADQAEKLNDLGLHKQVANRMLEPFTFISVIVTATDWDNWFELRDHPDAQPEIAELARKMRVAMEDSTPRLVDVYDYLNVGGWHLPYISQEERETITDPLLLAKMSAARCARVSYLTHDGKQPDQEKDLALYDRLVGSVPLHASPIEHQAVPYIRRQNRSRNFHGWHQFRSVVENNMSFVLDDDQTDHSIGLGEK